MEPTICDTDSDMSNLTNMTNQTSQSNSTSGFSNSIFRQYEIPIPNIPNISTIKHETDNTDETDNVYHCIATKGTKPRMESVVKNETISKIVDRLDGANNGFNQTSSDDITEYVTKAKFSALIGDMRVDLLSIIDLVRVLNKNLSIDNTEIQNVKKDVCKLIQENIQLKERYAEFKKEANRRHDILVKTYDAKFDELNKRVERMELTTKSKVNFVDNKNNKPNIPVQPNVNANQPSVSNIRPNMTDNKSMGTVDMINDINNDMKHIPIKSNDNVSTMSTISEMSTSTSTSTMGTNTTVNTTNPVTTNLDDTANNVIIDSQSNTKSKYVKVVPKRSVKNNRDVYGSDSIPLQSGVSAVAPGVIVTTNNNSTNIPRYTVRKEAIDNNIKKSSTTNQNRLNRLGLHMNLE